MLQSLRIRNLALLDEVGLDFEPGFTAVTGETGAGKSILLGALSLLAGSRAEKTVIRHGAAACEVEAALFFKNPRRIDAALAALDLPACEDGLLVLKRSLPRDKAPKITVNGGLATLATLQTLGELWIDFHGPGEPRRLLKESAQLELLDLFARNAKELAAYREQYRAWRALQAEKEKLARETKLAPDQIEFLQSQLAKMDRLELTEEAIATLERESQRLGRSQELIALAQALAAGLGGDDGLGRRLGELVRQARQLEALDPASRELAERLVSASLELADLENEFTTLSQQLAFDAEQAEQIQARLNDWLDVKRRHGGDVHAVLAARDDIRRRLEVQGDLAGALARLEKQIAEAEKAARKQAATLRAVREKAAQELAKAGAKAIAQLGFEKTEFQVKISPLAEPGPTGDCACEFLFSPNPGEPVLPLGRIASSGELARVMLALKTILADLDDIPLLVFDEVDANVGGEIGSIVGEKLAGIAKKHQVVCVTHLPQVAAPAASHLVVTKVAAGGRTVVRIGAIHGERQARVGELARMLGDRGARSALAHAEELLRGR
ncbi:MAG: DNA repair protein RecN [Verrucomicrobia bacterium RIFCSPLOWO2_12_FULL_64_8]|nr:MAG: DNA repair protein RecN [Verrucomicrobia bacterium RIFCSPLOWO2_12_FULL_64_8]